MHSFDDLRLAMALNASSDIERAIKFHVEMSESASELARGWEAYRSAVGLRKALDKWTETRRYRVEHAAECEAAEKA
jgi:hypothetical protein